MENWSCISNNVTKESRILCESSPETIFVTEDVLSDDFIVMKLVCGAGCYGVCAFQEFVHNVAVAAFRESHFQVRSNKHANSSGAVDFNSELRTLVEAVWF